MARWVTVSAVSAPAWNPGPDLEADRAAELIADGLVRRLAAVLPDKPDLVLLSEYCDERVTDAPMDYYRARGDRVRDRLAEVARDHGCHIGYSAVRQAVDGRWHNSLQLIDRAGAVGGTYDKFHLTIGEHDELGLTHGDAAPVFDLDMGRVACVICFDLNFDQLRERYAAARPDLVLFSSMFHGSFLQTQWAYSCRAWLVAAVRPPAPCGIVSPVGEQVAASTNYVAHVTHRINLDRVVAHLDFNGDRLAELKRRYGRGVSIHDPGLLGSVLVTSECDVPAEEMAAEVGLELLDDYLARCRSHRDAASARQSNE